MKFFRMIPVLLLFGALTGCTFPSGDELFAAPKPPANYQSLQVELDKLLSSGVTYTAPTGGENRSSIQLVDLDNDGVEEAIAFFRGSSSVTSNAFKVYIYKKQEEKYVCTGSVEGKGKAILSVEYPTITPHGQRGMLIAWKLPGDGVGALTMCDFNGACEPAVLLETEYSAMEVTDLTGNGAKDLLLLTNDPVGKRVARLYGYNSGKLDMIGEAATTIEAVSVERITSGRVRENLPAVFVEEKTTSGVGLTTDVFVYAGDVLQNLALDSEDYINRGTYRPVSVYATDINKDGITELPRAVLMAGYTDATASDAIYMLDWYTYSISKAPELVKTTYQNVSDGWMFSIDSAWYDDITVTKINENNLTGVEFAQYLGAQQKLPLFTIYCATGETRDYYENRADLIGLGSTPKALYFARIADTAEQSMIQITAEGIKKRFSIITQDWNN